MVRLAILVEDVGRHARVEHADDDTANLPRQAGRDEGTHRGGGETVDPGPSEDAHRSV
jgi:hypothetical protein